MKVVICSSIEFTGQIKEIANVLAQQGHTVEIPLTSQRIISGELTMEEFKEEKQNSGESAARKVRDDVIRRYFEIIKAADCILVLNLKKNGIDNYIGGNTFLEMGFAHILHKPIFLYSKVPDTSYTDEIIAMQPVVLDGDLSKLQ